MIETLSSTHPVMASCQAMNTPFRSYYHFATSGKTVQERRAIEDTLIRGEIEKLINGDCSKYGYRMMTRQLKKDGFRIRGKPVNHKRVLRVMRENNLLCEIKKSFINTTNSTHPFFKYPNILRKEHREICRLDQVWNVDFTYIRLPEGFCYLAVILDGFSRKVIGYCLSKDMDVDLVLTALKMAIQERKVVNADHKIIHHSDHGVQYCSHEYTDLLKFHGIRISMSDWQVPCKLDMLSIY